MRVLKRFSKQIVLTAVIGFVVRKLLASDDERAQRIGRGANKLVGGAFGPDEIARPQPRHLGRIAVRSAATAAIGGAVAYFFDPTNGAERRARVSTFARDRLRRNTYRPALPAPEQFRSGVPSQAVAPGVPS
jgi:hypothetical protein